MSLIRHWKCQDNAATTAIVDTMGNGNATLQVGNSADLSQVDGPGTAYPRSLLLNGSTHYATFSNVALTGVFSLFWRCKRSVTTSLDAIFGYASNNEYAGFPADAFGVQFNPVGGGSGVGTPPHGATSTAWNSYMLGRASDGKCFLYANGVLRTADFFSGTRAGTGTWSLIGKHTSGAAYLGGYLADLRIYDSDESANAATIHAEKDLPAGGGAVNYYKQMMAGA